MSTRTDNQARREGARAGMRAIAQLIKSAGEYYDIPEPATKNEAAEAFHVRRLNDAKALANAIGPFTPFQEGAVLAMAELLHEMTTTGEPLLDKWLPCAAMTDTQYRSEMARLVAGMDGE